MISKNYISVQYQNLERHTNIVRFEFIKNKKCNSLVIDGTFKINKKHFFILAALGKKGACSIVVKNSEKVIFSTIFDAAGRKFFGTVLFFRLTEDEYIQIDVWLEELVNEVEKKRMFNLEKTLKERKSNNNDIA